MLILWMNGPLGVAPKQVDHKLSMTGKIGQRVCPVDLTTLLVKLNHAHISQEIIDIDKLLHQGGLRIREESQQSHLSYPLAGKPQSLADSSSINATRHKAFDDQAMLRGRLCESSHPRGQL